MSEQRKINFEMKDFDKIELDVDDFKWLITQLYYICNDVGCVYTSMYTIENASNVLDVIYENDLNRYVDYD